MVDQREVEAPVLAALRAMCLGLPQVVEERAWVGTRWRVAGRTFAHVLVVADGWPPAYAAAVGSAGPLTVLMFRSGGEELDALRHAERRSSTRRGVPTSSAWWSTTGSTGTRWASS
jgi:hypothetical protein